MDDLILPPSHNAMASTPSALPEAALTATATALVIAPDRLIGHGLARILEISSVAASVEIHDSIESALAGPAVMLTIVHGDLPNLAAPHVAELNARRRISALLIAASGARAAQLTDLRFKGVRGLITGHEPPVLLASITRLVLAGGFHWPVDVAADHPPKIASPERIDSRHQLTERQWEVAKRIAVGMSNKTIAYDLNISEGTVKIHASAIFKALDVPNRTSAASKIIRMSTAALLDL